MAVLSSFGGGVDPWMRCQVIAGRYVGLGALLKGILAVLYEGTSDNTIKLFQILIRVFSLGFIIITRWVSEMIVLLNCRFHLGTVVDC